MEDLCTYQIEIRGRWDERELNAMSPWCLTILRVNPESTFASVETDQSGLIGLMRYLHGRGLTFMSIYREKL